jgi:thiol-disulfide isomerase/thioredoxin
VSLDRLDGNVLVVHFWATWCASCVEGMKSLNELQKLLRKDPVVIIPVSEDFKGSETVKAFYNKYKLNFLPAFLDKNNKWFKEMKVENLPVTFIIDSQGINVLRMTGEVDWLDEKNIELIKKYISAKQPYNQDYVALLNDYAAPAEKPKQEDEAAKNKDGLALLESIETNVALSLDDNIKQGEIGMVDSSNEPDFKSRRSVNAGINVGKQ